MLFEILKHIRNFFPDLKNQIEGEFEVKDGAISPSPLLLDGQYVLIEGSVLNDGIYQKEDLAEKLTDESFEGTVTPLKIPKAFLDLVAEIEAFQATEKPSTMASESFGGYSYTKATTATGKPAGWESAFGTRLNSWRKI